MTLPQLYKNLTLTSYDKIRYRGDQPEGMGSASPFSMGLNAVIIRPYASLVRSLTLRGDWREIELEEHARVGRVPDSSMMLNMAVRAAIDRMPELESFSWELSTKMLETVYLGLAKLPKLASLTVRFPSSRHPRPTIVIPPMPRLRVLKVTDIDPLCYPDDISTLLLKSKKLRELKMHWSPRMRTEQEPSVMLHNYFRKCIAAKQPLAVKRISLQNLYALHSEDFNLAFDPKTVEDVTVLSNTGPEVPNSMNTFVDSTWPTNPPTHDLKIKAMRQDGLSKRHADFLGSFNGLRRLYFVNARGDSTDSLNSPRYSTVVSSAAPTPPVDSAAPSNGQPANSPADSPASGPSSRISLRDSYLNSIITNHAPTLRHLLLPACWPLPASIAARLIHACPNLEQLAIATDVPTVEMLSLLLPFLRNLVAVRFLVPTSPATTPASTAPVTRTDPSQPGTPTDREKAIASVRTLADVVELDDDLLSERISECLADKNIHGNLKVIGMGRKAWELRDFYTIPAPPQAEQSPNTQPEGLNGTGTAPNDPEPTKGPDTPAPDSSNPQTPSHLPGSSLGKRRREADSPAVPDPTVRVNEPCGPVVYASDGRVWRRRVRRVGWDFLQRWAIWSLDTQEI